MKKIKKNIFITGGLGQDGKILISLLDADKYNIFVFSKKKAKNTIQNCKIFTENLKNKKKIRSHFQKKRPDIILHIASNNPSFNEKNHNLFYKENLLTTKNIFDEDIINYELQYDDIETYFNKKSIKIKTEIINNDKETVSTNYEIEFKYNDHFSKLYSWNPNIYHVYYLQLNLLENYHIIIKKMVKKQKINK